MDKPETNTQTELASRTAAWFSWLEFIGILIYLISRLGFGLGRGHWVQVVALLLVASGFIYRTYAAWKMGNKRIFWIRIIFLLVLVVVALYFGYRAGQKG